VDTTPTRRRPSRATSWISEHTHVVLDLAEVAAAAGVDITTATVYGYWYGDGQPVGSFQPDTEDDAVRLLDAWGVRPLTAEEISERRAERFIVSHDAVVTVVWAGAL